MQKLTMLAPGKVNLALDVLGRRDDGYHELDMVMQAVTLYETVRLEKRPAGVQLVCRSVDGALAPDVPTDRRNLAFRAAEAFFAAAGIPGGVFLDVTKSVPSQAGMAGGSADAAGVLAGLDILYGTHWTPAQLCAVGQMLGSDVPFCLVGGTARVQGRGERVRPLPPLPDCLLAAVMPQHGTATPDGFARYDAQGSTVHPDAAALETALAAGQLSGVCRAAGNALQQACATADTGTILRALRTAGAGAALLTGTGAVTYGIFAPQQRQQAAAVLETLRQDTALAVRGAWLLAPEARGPFAVESA